MEERMRTGLFEVDIRFDGEKIVDQKINYHDFKKLLKDLRNKFY